MNYNKRFYLNVHDTLSLNRGEVSALNNKRKVFPGMENTMAEEMEMKMEEGRNQICSYRLESTQMDGIAIMRKHMKKNSEPKK